jgi:chaperonin GroES
MHVKPLSDHIIVLQRKAEEETLASGLVIPEAVKETPQEGEVLAVGPGYYNEYHDKTIPLSVNVGDTVYFSKYGGAKVEVEGEEVLFMTERDLLAVKSKGE